MFQPLPPVRRGRRDSHASFQTAQAERQELNLLMRIAYLETQVEGLNDRLERTQRDMNYLHDLIDRRFGLLGAH